MASLKIKNFQGDPTYDDKDIFSLLLHYDNPISGTNAVADKSGNIVNMKWQVRGREEQVYGFLYDTYSRLTQGRHYDYNGAALQANGRYNTDYTYDKRGNILTLDRNGRTSMANCTSWGAIDDLNYTYPANTNKLTNVTDAIVGAAGDEGFKNTTSTSYTYDTNGNLTFDADKGVTITYNHLNLPKKISYSGSKYIEMVYDAAGNMLSRRTVDTGVDDLIDYIAGIEYFDGVTQSIMYEEGRVYYTSLTTSRYEYTISDHLGNARLMYTDLNSDGKVATPSEILWEGQYYPFGLAHNGAWMDQADLEINYKYNGIELAKDLGINLNLARFRTLDPAVGRWWQVDPKAGVVAGLSPYQSMGNNPILSSDPNGDLFGIDDLIIGGTISGIANGIGNVLNGKNFFSGFGKSFLLGAIGGATSAGIGSAFGPTSNFGHEALRAGAHAVSGGLQSSLQGGSLLSGALSGGLGSGFSSGTSALKLNDVAMLGIGGLSGGMGSLIGGGNFFHGAGIGLISSGLNHIPHKMQSGGYCPNCTDEETFFVDMGGEILLGEHGEKAYRFPDGTILNENEFIKVNPIQELGKLATLGIPSIKGINSTTTSLIIRNESWLNDGNWWRLGKGWNPKTNSVDLRLSWGAHPKHVHKVPEWLRPFNQWLRSLWGGHKHF